MQILFGKLGDRRAMSCLVAVLCAPLAAFADEPTGRVRISDSATAAETGSGVETAGFLRGNGDPNCPYCRRGAGATAANAPIINNGAPVVNGTVVPDGTVVDGTDADCFGGRCRLGIGGRCGRCGLGLNCCRCPITNIRPPNLAPIGRTEVIYQKYWPNQWMPKGSVAVTGRPVQVLPMVYQPTDTTQLGFYYMHVPYWTYQAGRLPPPPVPSWGFSYAVSANGVPQGTTTTPNPPLVPTPDSPPVPPPTIQSPPPAPTAPMPEARFGSKKFYD